MATIKTSGGKIITKGGKPSCTCCGPCSPNLKFLYGFFSNGDPEDDEYYVFEGSLNSGLFTEVGGDGEVANSGGSSWSIMLKGISEWQTLSSTSRCDPSADYGIDQGSFSLVISLTPF
jgi:hypothetical protein